MEAQIKATLGDELHQACENEDVDTIFKQISQQQATKSFWECFIPRLAKTISMSLHTALRMVLWSQNTLRKVVICRAKNTYVLFLDAKAVDANHYIPCFGDILSNVATSDDFEWAKLCLSHGANSNRTLYEEHKSI